MPSTTIPCPGCGVAVTVGYTRCPRCHAPMPSARIRRETRQAGGTSIKTAARPTPWPWIAGGALVAIGVIIAIVVAARGKPRAAAETDEDVEAEPVTPGVAAPQEGPPQPPTPPTRLDPYGAADRLERALASERLFAKSTLRGPAVELRSEFCATPRLRELIAEATADLRAQGLTSLRCIEIHGAEVFTQPL